jgi:hypothetical protein
MEKRILELALEALEGQRALLSAEIEMIRTQLDSGAKAKPNLKNARAGKRKARSAAQRKAQSERMKAYWAARKKAADEQMRSKPKSGQATPANRKGQTRKKQAEQKKKS